jgi:small ligand-binding sensory domain FIST
VGGVVIAAGAGLSVGSDPVEAAIEACLAAQDRSGAEHADLCVVFCTAPAHRAAHEMLHAVRRITGAHAVVGCSAAGILTERQEVEGDADGVAVAALVVRSDALEIAPFLVDETEGLGEAAGAVAASRVKQRSSSDTVMFLLPDPMGLEPAALLAGIARTAGPLAVMGGVASGAPLFELCNTESASGALAGLTLSGRAPVVGVAQGCEPIGEPFVITRGAGNLVMEIAGRPALDVLRAAMATVPGGERRIRAAGIFAGLAMDPAKSPLGRGDFLVRNLLGIDAQTNAVAVAEPVHVGQTIQFQIRDGQAAAQDLAATLAEVARALDGRPPAFGLYFNCAGRGRGLYGVADHDVQLIRERLGEFPLAGFFGNGEFAPVGGRNFFHTYTGVLVVYPDTREGRTP